jgi:hypothetical protein
MKQKKLSSIEFLAERYEYINWMLKRDEISQSTAKSWQKNYFNEAMAMHKREIISAYQEHYFDDIFLESEDYYNQKYLD